MVLRKAQTSPESMIQCYAILVELCSILSNIPIDNLVVLGAPGIIAGFRDAVLPLRCAVRISTQSSLGRESHKRHMPENLGPDQYIEPLIPIRKISYFIKNPSLESRLEVITVQTQE